jgi:hypothetical protein
VLEIQGYKQTNNNLLPTAYVSNKKNGVGKAAS